MHQAWCTKRVKETVFWRQNFRRSSDNYSSVPYKKLRVFISGYIYGSCVHGIRLCNMFDVLFVSVKPVVPAIWVSPEHVWRQFFHHLALSLTLTRTTTTNWNYGISWPSSQPLNPFTPWRSMCAGDSRHAWGAPCIYSLHLITPPLRKHLRNAAVIPGFCAGGHGLTMKCWWWRCCCTHLVRP